MTLKYFFAAAPVSTCGYSIGIRHGGSERNQNGDECSYSRKKKKISAILRSFKNIAIFSSKFVVIFFGII